jgi:hypothetical protein
MIPIKALPLHLDLKKLGVKFDFNAEYDCVVSKGIFFCPSRPDLTVEDLQDCVTIPVPVVTLEERLEATELMIDLLLDTQQETP